jgi:UDP-N-acetylmuramyl-tripeptide synthetase
LQPALERLGELIRSSKGTGPAQTQFTGLAYDSRRVETGNVFFCVPGEKTDGNEFIPQAVASGAVCIVSERPSADEHPGVLHVVVSDVRLALARVADYFFDHPSRSLRMIGVTGTNGKTTTTHLVEHILDRSGLRVGLIGTLGARWETNAGQREYVDVKHTTPQASDLQELLAMMVERKLSHVAMEVSSHALALKRVADCDFAVACLTNITQDHLDFHKTMENYWRSKRLLFSMLQESKQDNKTAIVNHDDDLAKEFIAAAGAKDVRCWSYGFDPAGDCSVVSASFDFRGTKLELKTPLGPLALTLKLNGRFNVYNTMAAILICLAEGVSLETCKAALEEFGGVPGRFEVVGSPAERGRSEPLCIVDYAHTPDGLENVLRASRALVPSGGRLIAVFGCGGDRDSSKRPQMGELAEHFADEVVVTSDNPRSEDPEQIIADILSGIKRMNEHIQVEKDRAAAIKMAVDQASNQDVIVVAGKGHETYQILSDRTIDFDDRLEVRRALANRH